MSMEAESFKLRNLLIMFLQLSTCNLNVRDFSFPHTSSLLVHLLIFRVRLFVFSFGQLRITVSSMSGSNSQAFSNWNHCCFLSASFPVSTISNSEWSKIAATRFYSLHLGNMSIQSCMIIARPAFLLLYQHSLFR